MQDNEPNATLNPKDLTVVNFFAGPGAGKSTTAAGSFAEAKCRGWNSELVTEYAKDKVWEKSFHTLSNQLYVMGKQHHRLHRLIGQVEVAFTDSPLLLTLIYNHQHPILNPVAVEMFNLFDNLCFFVERKKKYNPKGRMQTEEEARYIDETLLRLLRENNVPYLRVPGERVAFQLVNDALNDKMKGLSYMEISINHRERLLNVMTDSY